MEVKIIFSQKEACICINSILKTSHFYKQLPQNNRGELILFLKEKYFPSLTNEEVRSIEQAIADQSQLAMRDLIKYGVNILGTSKLAQSFKAFEKIVGKKDAAKVKEIFDQGVKSEMK